MSFLTEHKAGCLPGKPCRNCEAASFLRARLGEDDFRKLSRLLEEADGEPHENAPRAWARLDDLPESRILSGRAKRALHEARVLTLLDLLRHTEASLLRIPNFGRKSFNEVKAMLTQMGRQLGEFPGSRTRSDPPP